MTEVVAELLGNAYRPHRASRAEDSIREFRVAIDCKRVPRKLPAQATFQVLATPVRVAPLLPSVNQRVAQCNQPIRLAKRRSTFVEWLRVGYRQGQLILVKDWWPRHRRPEVCRNREHALPSASTFIRDVTLHFQVQLVDGRLQECGRGQHAPNHVSAMLPNDLGVHARAAMLFLELACELGQVMRGKEMVPVQARRHLVGRARPIRCLRRDVDLTFARQ